MNMTLLKPKELNEGFIRNLADKGPVVMVNLVRLRTRATDDSGAGWDAYVRYSEITMPLIKSCGGMVLWAGKAEGMAFGKANGRCWDYVVLVRYPSRKAFLDMVTSPDYATANVHRENAVEDHIILSCAESYSKFPLR